jgi:predicted acyl esterase
LCATRWGQRCRLFAERGYRAVLQSARGTFDGSYLSFTQLALASTRPPRLEAMAIGVWPSERRARYYAGRAFALDSLGWIFAIENAAQQAVHHDPA